MIAASLSLIIIFDFKHKKTNDDEEISFSPGRPVLCPVIRIG